jgi:hypothetical protein
MGPECPPDGVMSPPAGVCTNLGWGAPVDRPEGADPHCGAPTHRPGCASPTRIRDRPTSP